MNFLLGNILKSSSIIYLFFAVILTPLFTDCGSGDLTPAGSDCNLDELTVTLTPDNISLAAGSSESVTVRVVVTSDNCDNMGNYFYVLVSDINNPINATVQGCDYQMMAQNTGSCVVSVSVPPDTPGGTYTIQLRTPVSLRNAGWRNEFKPLVIHVASQPDYRLAMVPPTIGVIQGRSFTITASIDRLGDHSESIEMSLDYLPQRLSYVYEPNPIPGDENSSQLTITAEPNAVPGDYSIRAMCTDGTIERFGIFPLYVNEPFNLSVDPAFISIVQGQNATVDVTVEPKVGGFNNWVMLTTESAIVGQGANLVDTTFNPNPVPPIDIHTSELTLIVGESVPPGTYPVTINGLGGTVTKSTEFQLTVTEKK